MYLRTEEALDENPFKCQVDYNGDGVAEWIPKDIYERIRLTDVEDGTTNTIAAGEASYSAALKRFPIWAGTAREDGSILFKTQDRDQLRHRRGRRIRQRPLRPTDCRRARGRTTAR